MDGKIDGQMDRWIVYIMYACMCECTYRIYMRRCMNVCVCVNVCVCACVCVGVQGLGHAKPREGNVDRARKQQDCGAGQQYGHKFSEVQ